MSRLGRIVAVVATGALAATGAAAAAQRSNPPLAQQQNLSRSAAARASETNSPTVDTVTDRDARDARSNAATDGHHRPVPATSADVVAGARVMDKKGQLIGTVQSVTDDGAVVDTGTARAAVPLNAFGKDDAGLLLGVTKKQFEAMVQGDTKK